MTNPPTDEELHAIYENAWDAGANGHAAHRALFTAGERRGIERAIEAILRAGERASLFDSTAADGLRQAAITLESLRDAPAGEQKERCVTCFDWLPGAASTCPNCGRVFGAEPPAKPEAAGEPPFPEPIRSVACNHTRRLQCPCGACAELRGEKRAEAAGEEPAIVHNLRSLQRAYAEDPSGKANDPLAYGLGWDELDELLAFIDRPAPAAKEAVELRCSGCDATKSACDAMVQPAIKCCPDCKHEATSPTP